MHDIDISWVFLAVAAVVTGWVAYPIVGTLLSAYRAAQHEPAPAHVPRGVVWDWARGLWMLWLGRMDEQLLNKDLAREFLSLQWRIHDAAAAARFLRKPPKDEPPRPLLRRVQQVAVARLAVPADFLSEHEAANAIRGVATKLGERFDSWEQVGHRFVDENTVARTTDQTEPAGCRGLSPSTAGQNRDHASSDAWARLAFDADLHGEWSKGPPPAGAP